MTASGSHYNTRKTVAARLPLRCALVIPAHNEAPVIGITLDGLPAGWFQQILVADNGSTDGTGEAAARHGAQVVRIEEKGYGAACLAAIEALRADIEAVLFLQADGSEQAAEASDLVTPLAEGTADLVIGSRVLGRAAAGSLLPHQRFGNWLAAAILRVRFGVTYTDLGPFRAIRAEALRALGMRDRNYGWTVEMQMKALRAGLRVVEVPVSYGLRKAGENKVSGNLRASLRAGWVILRIALFG